MINNLLLLHQLWYTKCLTTSRKVSRYELAIYVLLMNVLLLLLDEDSCATNFMSCDSLMCELVQPKSEPITTLLERIRELHEVYGVSSIIIVGGCGAYFSHHLYGFICGYGRNQES